MVLVFLPLILSYLIILWLDTNVLVEYTDLLKIYKYVPILKNYYNVRQQGCDSSFISYLSQFYDGFFVRLITCEICMSAWLGMIGSTIIYFYCIKYGILFYMFYSAALPYLILLSYKIIKKL